MHINDHNNVEQLKEFRNIKAIIFDLDGTLYEDTAHFSYYAERLKKRLPEKKRKNYEEDYRKALDGKHPLMIGRIYDVKRDLILVQIDHVREVYRWDGSILSEKEINNLYPEPVSLNNHDMINIGDQWWVPNAIAHHYGLEDKETYQAFLETREYMKGPDYEMNRVPGLKRALWDLKEVVSLILITNSPRPDSEAILGKLGLGGIFAKKIFNADKPAKTYKQFFRIRTEFGLEYSEILSIGDNYLNEILPARRLGLKYIFIDQNNLGFVKNQRNFVADCSEMVEMLKELPLYLV